MTKVKDITDIIEAFAPLSLQESYDNSGLIIGRPDNSVTGVLLAVDLTIEVIEEAIEKGVNMIATHHPIVFTPLKRFNSASYVESAVEMAIRNNINVYACHTNLDSAQGGTSWRLAEMLGVKNISTLLPSASQIANSGFGIIGEFERDLTFHEALERMSNKLNINSIRHSEPTGKSIKKVAICTGSGGSLIEQARCAGADLYITADLRYNDFMIPQKEFDMVDIGHFESEYCAIDILYDVISKKMITFALYKSAKTKNPVFYWHK